MIRSTTTKPPALEPARFAEELARALDAGDVACVQLRLKEADDDAIRRAVDALDDLLVPLLVERSGYMTQAYGLYRQAAGNTPVCGVCLHQWQSC